MQVSYIVSIRLSILVKDSISYDLHNTGEIMIMQMRTKRENVQQTIGERRPAGNSVRPGNNQRVKTRLQGVFGSDQK